MERTPLHITTADGGQSIVETMAELIKEKPNWDCYEDKGGRNPLHVAYANPAEIAVDIVKRMVNKGTVTNDATGFLGQTALHLAVGEGNIFVEHGLR